MSSSDADDFDQDDLDDDDSDSDSSDAGGGAVGAARGFLAQLKEDLKKAPFDREFHIALISTLREKADLDGLSAARRQAAARVALPEAVWLEWLQDEANLAGEGSFGELDALHEAACSACPTSRIWLARCQFHQEEQHSRDAASIRAVYEEALSILGLHPGEGPEVWADYRSFEEKLLAAATAPAERTQLAQRVRALFMRQLALPLPGVARLREAHSTFESSLEPAASNGTALAKAEALASSSLLAWQQREPLEQRLQVACRPAVTVGPSPAGSEEAESPAGVSAELLAAEEASGDRGRALAGHLRATQHAPQEAARWLHFADFAANQLNDSRRAVEVLERGVRHCVHSSELWLQLHLEHQGAGTSLSGLRSVLERGLAALGSAGPERSAADVVAVQELLLQHADAVRRASAQLPQGDSREELWTELRAVLERAVSLAQAPGVDAALSCQALLRWMRLEAYAIRDAKATLKVGHRLMKLWGSYYNVWSAFIAAALFCLGENTYATIRDLYKAAMAQVADYPDQVLTDYLQFERELGTFESWRQAKRYADQRAAAAAAQAAPALEAHSEGAPLEGQAEPVEHESTEETAPATQAPKQRPSNAQPKRANPKKRPRLAMANKSGASTPSEPASAAEGAPGPAAASLTDGTSGVAAASVGTTPSGEIAKSDSSATAHKPKDVDMATAPPVVPEGEAAKSDSSEKAQESKDVDMATAPPVVPEGEAAKSGSSAEAQEPKKVEVATALPAATKVEIAKSDSSETAQEPKKVEVATASHSAPKAESLGTTSVSSPAPVADLPGVASKKEKETASSPGVPDVQPDAATQTATPGAGGGSDEAVSSSAKPPGTGEAPGDKQGQAAPAPDKPSSNSGDAEPRSTHAHTGSHYHQKRMEGESITPEHFESEGQRTVHVCNLDWSVDEPHLRRIFSAIDGLKDVRLVRDFLQRSKGYAYIDFETSEQVDEAVERLNGALVNKRALRVARSLPTKPLFEERTVFVRGVGPAATEKDVRDAFAAVGEVADVRMPADATGKVHKGYAYVEFATADGVKAALAKDGIELAGAVLQVARSIPMKDHRHQTAAPRKDLPQRANQRSIVESKLEREDPVRQSAKFPTTIYVKNLAFQVDENMLRDHFSSCGEVSQVLLVRNGQGRSRGFGFIEFKDAESAQAALLLTDSQLAGRDVVVSRSQRAITQKKAPAAAAAADAAAPAAAPAAAAPAAGAPAKRPAAGGAPAPAKRLKLEEAAAPEAAEGPAKAKGGGEHKPFRTTKELPPPAAPAPPGAAADTPVPTGPLSNADFRALFLGAGR